MDTRFIIIIPFYNHIDQFQKFIPLLESSRSGIDVLVYNDGSDKSQTKQIQSLCNQQGYYYAAHPINQGKGEAVIQALKWSQAHSYSHAIQIDADGQHDLKDLTTFINASSTNPSSIICGIPIYDSSVPRSRSIGHRITNFWIRVETCSNRIKDAMCGYRIYPIDLITKALDSIRFKRMGFDIEILVKACWEKIDIYNIPTHVIYPDQGLSHFNVLKDNLNITYLHTYLCLISWYHLIKRIFIRSKTINTEHNSSSNNN